MTSATDSMEMIDSENNHDAVNLTHNLIKGQKAVSQFDCPTLKGKEDCIDLIGDKNMKPIEWLMSSELLTITIEVEKNNLDSASTILRVINKCVI